MTGSSPRGGLHVMNVTPSAPNDLSLSPLLSLCLNNTSANDTFAASNASLLCNVTVGGADPGVGGGASSRKNPGVNIKVFHMQPAVDTGNRLYLNYDPMIGIRTAAILGGALFIMVIYILYKANCRRRHWTSEDQLFLEKYRRRIHDRYRKNNHSNGSRWSMGNSVKDSFAMENTAKWIQSQPLNTAIPKKTIKTMSNMCNICIDSFHNASCPMCSNSDIQVSNSVTDTTLSVLTPESAHNTGPKSIRKVDRALLDVCHLHLPALGPNYNDTKLIANDIHQESNHSTWRKNISRRGHKTRKSKNSNLEHDNISLTLSPTQNLHHMDSRDSRFCVEHKGHDPIMPKNLDKKTSNPYPMRLDMRHDSLHSDNMLGLPCDLNHSRSPCSSLSDSIDLDKHIDVGIHNTSPLPQRALLPQLKYLPLYTMPVTNITVSSTTELSPKTPMCVDSMLEPRQVSLQQEAPSSELEVPLLENLVEKTLQGDRNHEVDTADNKESLSSQLQFDIKVNESLADEGISLKELSQGLKYIDAVEENEEGNLLPTDIVVTRL